MLFIVPWVAIEGEGLCLFVENEEDKRKRLQKLLIASVVVKIRNSHIKTLLLEVMVYEYKSRNQSYRTHSTRY